MIVRVRYARRPEGHDKKDTVQSVLLLRVFS